MINAVVENIVPVIETGTGIVHVYVDKDADEDKALAMHQHAKTSRPSCLQCHGSLALVHEDKAAGFLQFGEGCWLQSVRKLDWNQFEFRLIAQQVSLFQVEQLRTKTC